MRMRLDEVMDEVVLFVLLVTDGTGKFEYVTGDSQATRLV